MTLIAILCIYTIFILYISYEQIKFLKKEKEQKAIILDENEYKNAADIAIENEKY
ncbi:M48 family peptidase, partial [Campylobacter volucris]|nr:M48 family peptidase [Campylobacter volucris]